MNTKKTFIKAILEAKFMANAKNVDALLPKLKKDDIVKVVDEAEINEAPAKNNPKIEKFVLDLNQLITSAIDSDGDPIPVIDKSSTWEEPYIYYPILYKNGSLLVKSKSVYKNDIESETILKRNMEFDGIPYLKLIKRLYTAALKKHKNNSLQTNDINETPNEEKTFDLNELHKLAQKAGNFNIDLKESILNLYFKYKETTPISKIEEVLNEYDLNLEDLNGDSLNEKKCWAGYKKVGTKIDNGKRVNNCVKTNEEELTEQDWEELSKKMNETVKPIISKKKLEEFIKIKNG
jgi:hypothetical protein